MPHYVEPGGMVNSSVQLVLCFLQLYILHCDSVQHHHHLLLLKLAAHSSLVLELNAETLSQALQCPPLTLGAADLNKN